MELLDLETLLPFAKRHAVKIVAFGTLGILGLMIANGGYYSVPGNKHAVVTMGGKYERVEGPGWHWKIPGVEDVVLFDTGNRPLSTPLERTLTVDNQEVDAVVNVQFNIPPASLQYTYEQNRQYGAALEQLVTNVWRDIAGSVNIATFASERPKLEARLFQRIHDEAWSRYKLDVTYTGLSNVALDAVFTEAQKRANLVKTETEQSRSAQIKARIDAENTEIQARGVANAEIEHARGQATSEKLAADAEAYATKVKGEAQAEAKKSLAAAISASPSLVAYETAQKWNGRLPENIYAGAPIPFIGANVK